MFDTPFKLGRIIARYEPLGKVAQCFSLSRLGDRSKITFGFDMRFASKITQRVPGYF